MVRALAAFEEYFQHTIAHALQLPVSPTFLSVKLAQVEDSKLALEATVLSLQLRLHELEERLTKFKDEASISASALRKQVAENQSLREQLKEVSQRCLWLEEECSLYHSDRELFRGVAEEAEDRAFQAEERFNEAERKMEQILADLGELKNLKNEHAHQKEELGRMSSKVLRLETANASLQAELSKAEQKLAQSPPLQRASESSAVSSCVEDGVFGSSLNDKGKEQLVNKEKLATPQLMAEVQRLWKEVTLYQCNLARAEIQVRILDSDNKDLRSALRNRMSTAASPASKKGKTSSSLFDNMGAKKDARLPLSALEPNIKNLG